MISKSVTTLETLTNAREARQWLCAQGCAKKDLRRHFVAVTAKPQQAIAFGVHANDILPMWDWVGGRTSELGPVGLLPALLQGIDIEDLLAGAASMDVHTRHRDTMQNPAALLALMW